LWLGSIQLLGAQLIALGTILDVVAGVPFAIGCSIGGLLIVVYFSAGGLLTAAWVNAIQLTVKLCGFALALPLAAQSFGGWGAISGVRRADDVYWDFFRSGPPGLMYLVMLVPAFIVSPGLLQKIFGARDDRAVRLGVGANALGLLAYAASPVILGIIARGRFPELTDERLALPMILMYGLPPAIGAIGLAAVFSAEVSAADAALFMLTTSLSQDLYKRFANPTASDAQVLRVARLTTIVAGSLATLIAIFSASIVNALTIFYTLLGVTLFVPVIAGLYSRRTSSGGAMASIVAGVAGMLVVQEATDGKGWALATPALVGLGAAVTAWTVSLAMDSVRGRLETTSS
jgi:SSS family solute:Na+ symporter